MKIEATKIIGLLREKHSKDVFVPECAWGPAGGQRIDAWAMACSWVHPLTYGYEVKVSRNDFLRDNKWQAYLDLCSDFYFVCPSGLIQPEEVGPEAGLLWVAKTGTRLYTKKKAPRRDVVVPEDLYRYVLMWRSKITREREQEPVERWRSWLARQREKKKIGYEIRDMIRASHLQIEEENVRLRNRIQKIESLEAEAERLGIDLKGWSPPHQLRDLHAGQAVRNMRRAINGARSALNLLSDELDAGEGA